MSPADPRRLKDLFAAAVAVPESDARRAFLDEKCDGDADLRRRLEVLLQAHDHPISVLERPLVDPPSGLSTINRVDLTGTVISSRYKLLEKIGEGGMGEVWVADQLEPVKRRVALKLIKPGMDTKAVLARFEAERQALALMDHPNIAKVLAAETTDEGRPFFVMELVKGTPITTFCDVRKLTPKQRLELFVPVCQAIQHAHQKGIIHRDVKPANVLVELYDDRPVPKVIDFGVAKAIGYQLTDKTIYTGYGALVGTPSYMAPEQATFNALDVDTRADVYALGVLLYELLAGSPPFEPERLRQAALDEMLRVVREEEPPRPSTRLSTSRSKASIAATRQSDPDALARLVRGELDWIVMKALEKDRTRRYETANSLAKDVARYLADERVEACPPTLGYRVQKFAHRHRTALAVVIAFVFLLAVGAVVSTVLAVRATDAEAATSVERDNTARERDAAIDARDKARTASESLRIAQNDLRDTRYVWDMQLVPTTWEAGNFPQARQLLARQPDDLRGFEWYYWDRIVNAERRVVKLPVAPVTSRRWTITADGSKVITATPAEPPPKPGDPARPVDQLFKVWAADTGKELVSVVLTQSSGSANVSRVQFSRDGSRVAFAWTAGRVGPPAADDHYSPYRRVRVMEVASGKVLIDHQPKGEDVSQWNLSPDGRRFVAVVRTGGLPGTPAMVRGWDVDIGDVTFEVPGDAGGSGPPYSPDGGQLAVTVGREVRVLDSTTGAPVVKWKGAFDMTPCLTFTADGRLAGVLKSGTNDNWSARPVIWEAATGKPVFTLPPVRTTIGRYVIPRLVYSDDGSRLAVCVPLALNRGLEATVYDAKAGKELFSFTSRVPHDSPAFTHDGKRLVAGDGVFLVLRDATTGQILRTFPSQGSNVEVYTISADDRRLVTVEGNGTLAEWNTTEAVPVTIDPRPWTRQETVQLSPRGDQLAAVAAPQSTDGREATVQVWDPATGKETRTFPLPPRPTPLAATHRFAFSADGRHLALARGGLSKEATAGELIVWDLTTGERRAVIELPPVVVGMNLSADGSRVAVAVGGGAANREVKVFDTGTGRSVHTIPAAGIEFGPTISPDGTRIGGTVTNATGPGDSKAEATVKVWDAADGREVQSFAVGGTATSPIWSPDGTRVAVGVRGKNGNGILAVYDIRNGTRVASAEDPNGVAGTQRVGIPAFSPDGRRIAAYVSGLEWSTAGVSEMRVWDAASGREVLALKTVTPGRIVMAFRADGRAIIEAGTAHSAFAAAPAPGSITVLTRDATPRSQEKRP